MAEDVVEIKDLYFSYRRHQVLKGVNLKVEQGSIFGFLGRNGAGKTTTMKLLLGLLEPASGHCKVNGVDPQKDALNVKRSVGFMAEDQQMYGWMRIEEILKWVASLYPAWDHSFASRLVELFDLPLKSKVKSLSKGQNTRLALLLALGHRPKVVILDDPTLGLDPIARKAFLRYVIDILQNEGVTVLFSSHLLYEIEPVADHVAILHEGTILKSSETQGLRETVRGFLLTPRPDVDLESLPGILDLSRSGHRTSIVLENCDDQSRKAVKQISTNGIQETALNLDEIFEAYVIGNRGRETKAW